MDLLWGTILLRPYVFAFLAIYLAGASLQFGLRPTLIFLPIGYLIAFASEFASIHVGFPYGDYHYVPSTLGRELWVFGVPFMDSLSYVFLAACSYASAVFLLSPFSRDDRGMALIDNEGARRGWAPWLLGALLMVLLDIIIDPTALHGERWFLGKIYGYRTPGAYFGIPMSNFVGWLLVGLVMVRVFQAVAGQWGRGSPDVRWRGVTVVPFWGPALFLGILLFILVVTFAIGEIALGFASSFLTGTFVTTGGALILYKMRHPSTRGARLDSPPSPTLPAQRGWLARARGRPPKSAP